jgi:sugar/nucleoside kinase (ribokinase family)
MNLKEILLKTKPKYDFIVGTGGIGSGIFFSLEGNENLGREESRQARLEPFRDFCKQHIILHYISVFLSSRIKIFPIGAVGNDEIGKQLIGLMQEAGMSTVGIKTVDELRTLFSVCYQFPDKSGGNITTNNDAGSRLTEQDIQHFFYQNLRNHQKGITLAAPEVPIDVRLELLRQGRKSGTFNVAAVSAFEMQAFIDKGGFGLIDLISINISEALALTLTEIDGDTDYIANKAFQKLKEINPNIIVLVTDGANGSYAFYQEKKSFTPAIQNDVISTAGAGDAFLSGILTGLVIGLPIFKEKNQLSAVELATCLASMKVGSADTIHFGINIDSLDEYLQLKLLENAL